MLKKKREEISTHPKYVFVAKYRADYNNRPPSAVSFMPAIASTSGRLHSEFVRLLFLQAQRETDRFFAASGVQSGQSTSGGFFHFPRSTFLSGLKSKVGLVLAKEAALRIVLNLDGAPITSKSHTHPSQFTLANFSFVNLVFIFRSSSSTTNPVCESRVDLLVCSLPLHRHSYIGFIFIFRFIDS